METLALLQYIRKSAEERIRDITETAHREAATIASLSAQEADKLKAQLQERVRGEAVRLRERRSNANRYRDSLRRYTLKAAAIDAVWKDVTARVEAIARSERYGDILAALVRESIPGAPDDAVVHVHPDDVARTAAVIEASGRALAVAGDPSVSGGCEVYWPDGKMVLRNTLAGRLERLKVEGGGMLSQVLFGSDGDA